jgi:hypothetical protein
MSENKDADRHTHQHRHRDRYTHTCTRIYERRKYSVEVSLASCTTKMRQAMLTANCPRIEKKKSAASSERGRKKKMMVMKVIQRLNMDESGRSLESLSSG